MSTQLAFNRPAPHSVLPNSYWVVPGRLLAGEHPGARTLSDTTDRLQALLFAGVTLFLDLSEEDEAPQYSHLLMYAAGADPINYERHAFPDHGVPESAQQMQAILDAIDAHLAKQGVVYVHCRTGLGRTATVIACYLVRMGLGGAEALDRFKEVWSESERATTVPHVPLTKSQLDYINKWQALDPRSSAPQPRASNDTNRYIGAIYGLAIGEALGAQLAGRATSMTSSGTQTPADDFGDSTAMCWSLGESLLTHRAYNAEDAALRFQAWQQQGEPARSTPPAHSDVLALARTVAAALYFSNDPTVALQKTVDTACDTQLAPQDTDGNRAFAALLLDALLGLDKESLLSVKQGEHAQRLRALKLPRPVRQVIDGWWRGPIPPARTGSDVLAVLDTVLWAMDRTDDFRSGLILAVNSCANPMCGGALYGALAGAHYGADCLPHDWCNAIPKSQALADLAQRLAEPR